MSGYLRSTPFEALFDGDNVKARLKPLRFEDFLKVDSAKTDMDAVGVFQKILPEYAEGFSGLVDKAGQEVSISEVCANMYFISLVSDMGKALISASIVTRPQTPVAHSAS